MILDQVRSNPRRVVFAEGEDNRVIRAAVQFRNAGYGEPILIGREDRVRQTMAELGLDGAELEIRNARLSDKNQTYTDFLYKRLQRDGFLARDCQRLVNQDRNVFGACMVENGDADAMLTGVTRVFSVAFNEISRVVDLKPNQRLMGVSLVAGRNHSFLIADTRIHEVPNAEELADIAEEAAQFAQKFGHDPRVALLSFSNFGQPMRPHMERIRDAVAILEERKVDFEFDGDMQADVALNYDHEGRFPVLPPDRPSQCVGHAGAAQRQHQLQPYGRSRRRHRDWPGFGRPLKTDPNRTARRVRQRSCQHRRFCRPRRHRRGDANQFSRSLVL